MKLRTKAEKAIQKHLGLNLYFSNSEAAFTDNDLNRVYVSYTYNDDYSKIKVKQQVFGDTIINNDIILSL